MPPRQPPANAVSKNVMAFLEIRVSLPEKRALTMRYREKKAAPKRIPHKKRLDGACFAKYLAPTKAAIPKKVSNRGKITVSAQPVFIKSRARSRITRVKIKEEKSSPFSK